jgi:hypothetical protein
VDVDGDEMVDDVAEELDGDVVVGGVDVVG